MDSTVINIKTDPKLKSQAQKIAKGLGFSLSSVINAYLKQFVRTKSVNFSLYDESHPSKRGIKALKESQKDIKEGHLSPPFTNTTDAIKWLDSEADKR
jgi:addiction module RelB/DinJ family antitoxin